MYLMRFSLYITTWEDVALSNKQRGIIKDFIADQDKRKKKLWEVEFDEFLDQDNHENHDKSDWKSCLGLYSRDPDLYILFLLNCSKICVTKTLNLSASQIKTDF